MRKITLVFFMLVPFLANAQEENNTAFTVGKVVGIVVAAGFVIWLIRRRTRNK